MNANMLWIVCLWWIQQSFVRLTQMNSTSICSSASNNQWSLLEKLVLASIFSVDFDTDTTSVSLASAQRMLKQETIFSLTLTLFFYSPSSTPFYHRRPHLYSFYLKAIFFRNLSFIFLIKFIYLSFETLLFTCVF